MNPLLKLLTMFGGTLPHEYMRKSVSKKNDGLPRNYPGAKLARKAMMNQVAVKHPRGMRLDGVTV